jgi:hypothetical protein
VLVGVPCLSDALVQWLELPHWYYSNAGVFNALHVSISNNLPVMLLQT